MELRKHQCGSLRPISSGGRAAVSYRSETDRPAGVEDQGKQQLGFPRNLGDPVVSTEQRGRGECRNRSLPGPPVLMFRAGGSELRDVTDGIAKRRQRSAARRAAGSRSVLIVSSKPGNGAPPGPGGEKRDAGSWTR